MKLQIQEVETKFAAKTNGRETEEKIKIREKVRLVKIGLLKYFSNRRKMTDVYEEDSAVMSLGRDSKFLAMPKNFEGKEMPFGFEISIANSTTVF